MIIEKIKIKNYKRFYGEKTIVFNDKMNVIIGDNESGKSSILQAIDIVLSGSYSKVETIGLENLFNVSIINEFMDGEKKYEDLPQLYIEVFFSDTGNPDLNGEVYSDGIIEKDGLRFECIPDIDFSTEIIKNLSTENCVFPFEYYLCTFRTFSQIPYNNYKKFTKHVLIDNSSVNNEYAMREYVNSMYNSCTDSKIRNYHKSQYRKSKVDFRENALKSFNETLSDITFGLSNGSKFDLENVLTIYEDCVNICNKGTGKQCMVKTEFTLNKKIKDLDFILIEEPENHLSHTNMKKLINKIAEQSGKQMFLTTHNNMISSRLDLRNLICMNSNGNMHLQFNDISEDTAKFFIKSPYNEILNFILSKRVILVEGAAEYILIEKFYEILESKNAEYDDVSIISVNGLSFLRYLEVAKNLNIKVAVITDNDHDYENNINQKYNEYNESENIKIFSDDNNENYTFEVCLYNNNINYISNKKISNSNDKQKFMLNNKSESAYRILEELCKSKEIESDNDNEEEFIIPEYIKSAIKWIKS